MNFSIMAKLPVGIDIIPPNETNTPLFVGMSAGAKLPTVFDSPDVWDPTTEECEQARYKDYTGVDSLVAFFLSIVVYIGVQYLEHCLGRPLFTFPGGTPYDKPFPDSSDHDDADDKKEATVETVKNAVDVNLDGGLVPVRAVAAAAPMFLHQYHVAEPKSEMFA
jgi:hypothetical protein